MKIQSHNISMQTQHTFEQKYESSQISFMSLLKPSEPIQVQSSKLQETQKITEHTTLNALIASLINILQKCTDTQVNEQSEQNQQGAFMEKISLHEHFFEAESLSYTTVAQIKTQDKEMNLDLNFSMSRSFMIENNIDIYSTFDPLVINLEGEMPQLSRDTFSFDIDNDGTKDQISELTASNGFLALDKNNDGIINQGSELFGTSTGNGFKELAAYDQDNNDWIDENDTIFNSLRVWMHDETTQVKELLALGEVGIGAIYLNAVAGEYSYKTQENETLGELKGCSFFLNEDGTCGNISQIDFAKQETIEEQTPFEEPLGHLLQA